MCTDKKLVRKLNHACGKDVTELVSKLSNNVLNSIVSNINNVDKNKRLLYIIRYTHSAPYIARIGKSYIMVLSYNSYISVESKCFVLHTENTTTSSSAVVKRHAFPSSLYPHLFKLCEKSNEFTDILLHHSDLIYEYIFYLTH